MTHEFVHNFLGENGVRSRCIVKIFSDDGENFILFENMGIGVSVTNATELLATQIVEKFRFNPGDCRFFETYQEYDYESIDEIEYRWAYNGAYEGWVARNANWKPAEDMRNYFFE